MNKEKMNKEKIANIKIVNVKKQNLVQNGYIDFEDWSSHPNHLYIGRNMNFYVKGTIASKWANPFPVKKFGLNKCLELYKHYIVTNKELFDSLHELVGKELGCWCYPNRCHGDILVELCNDNL